jgi:hypothetical protein
MLFFSIFNYIFMLSEKITLIKTATYEKYYMQWSKKAPPILSYVHSIPWEVHDCNKLCCCVFCCFFFFAMGFEIIWKKNTVWIWYYIYIYLENLKTKHWQKPIRWPLFIVILCQRLKPLWHFYYTGLKLVLLLPTCLLFCHTPTVFTSIPTTMYSYILNKNKLKNVYINVKSCRIKCTTWYKEW